MGDINTNLWYDSKLIEELMAYQASLKKMRRSRRSGFDMNHYSNFLRTNKVKEEVKQVDFKNLSVQSIYDSYNDILKELENLNIDDSRISK